VPSGPWWNPSFHGAVAVWGPPQPFARWLTSCDLPRGFSAAPCAHRPGGGSGPSWRWGGGGRGVAVQQLQADGWRPTQSGLGLGRGCLSTPCRFLLLLWSLWAGPGSDPLRPALASPVRVPQPRERHSRLSKPQPADRPGRAQPGGCRYQALAGSLFLCRPRCRCRGSLRGPAGCAPWHRASLMGLPINLDSKCFSVLKATTQGASLLT